MTNLHFKVIATQPPSREMTFLIISSSFIDPKIPLFGKEGKGEILQIIHKTIFLKITLHPLFQWGKRMVFLCFCLIHEFPFLEPRHHSPEFCSNLLYRMFLTFSCKGIKYRLICPALKNPFLCKLT